MNDPMSDALAASILNDHKQGLHDDMPRLDAHTCNHPRCDDAWWWDQQHSTEGTPT